jgi:hypothetical protein
MQEFVRSVAGAALQTAQLLGKPVVIKANTTLNQKFDIQATTAIAEDDVVSMKYATIGNGGVRVVTGTNGVAKLKAVQHSPRDAGLYNHLPFVLRLPNDDLDPAQRSKYRLRKYETHGGRTYAAYYLKVLDLTSTVPQLELRSVANGVTTSTPYTPTLADLSPTPPAVDDTVLVATGNYIAATAKVPFTLSTWEIEEFLNVCNIIYDDEDYAMISEIGICSGVDRAVTGDFNGTSSGYTEAIGVQICTFINTSIPVKFINTSYTMTLDTGSLEPLLELTPTTP